MSRILLCTMLMAMLSGGQTAQTSITTDITTRTDHVTSTRQASQTGLVTPTGPTPRVGPDDAGDKPGPQFSWPLPGFPTVVRAFHPPAFRYGPGHLGVDLAAVAGVPVLAAGAGTVVFAGTVAGHGVVSVDHPGGLRTTYEPVSPTTVTGARVAKGERIGTVAPGHPGCPVMICLHWGLLRGRGLLRDWGVLHGAEHDREYLDPLRLLTTGRVRLLPIDGPPDRQLRPRPPEVGHERRSIWREPPSARRLRTREPPLGST